MLPPWMIEVALLASHARRAGPYNIGGAFSTGAPHRSSLTQATACLSFLLSLLSLLSSPFTSPAHGSLWRAVFSTRGVSRIKEPPSELRVRPSFLPSLHPNFASFHVVFHSLDMYDLLSFLRSFLPSFLRWRTYLQTSLHTYLGHLLARASSLSFFSLPCVSPAHGALWLSVKIFLSGVTRISFPLSHSPLTLLGEDPNFARMVWLPAYASLVQPDRT